MTAGSHTLPGIAPGSAGRLALRRGQGEAAGFGSTALMVKAVVGVVAPLTLALAVLGGIGSFATVRDLAVPWFGKSAWIVPVGIDIGILALLAWDLLTEYLGVPGPSCAGSRGRSSPGPSTSTSPPRTATRSPA
jgi:hypothetical protein